jgi:hypothetical protein
MPDVSDDVIGRILNHAASGVTRRHHNHAQRFEEMRRALDRWAVEVGRIIDAPVQHVVDAPRAAA